MAGLPQPEGEADYVTADSGLNSNKSENEAISCPRVPCKRMCTHGFQTDRHGCPICKCLRCPSIQRCHKKCPLGLVHDSRGCPSCQCRTANSSTTSFTTADASLPSSGSSPPPSIRGCPGPANRTYAYGERWQLDECTQCLCHPGGPTCTEATCPLPCHNAVFIPVIEFHFQLARRNKLKFLSFVYSRANAVHCAVIRDGQRQLPTRLELSASKHATPKTTTATITTMTTKVTCLEVFTVFELFLRIAFYVTP